ncbi:MULTISPECIES: hypothetical protein [Catenuloplanes]|uniref:Calcineurin-like phosphoesterase domain-containing protein n=1 Tax=Catenuloplanes niger TaxID=587534 RepID=A0AAE3ZZ30_9ACTN|nr:hypothetical protein [Catenuloplanes niger]MDR7327471.1 hypothetical protein [Catenuloplanes niger]
MNDPAPGRSDFKLTWLHLSDFHFDSGGPHATAGRDDVLGALVDDIRRLPRGVPPTEDVTIWFAGSGCTDNAAKICPLQRSGRC